MNHIGELLVERGLISDQQLSQIDPSRELDGESLLSELDRKKYVDRHAAYDAMAEEFGVEFIDLANTEVDLTLLETFPQKVIYRQIIFPVRKENGTLIVATADPSDYYPLDEVSAATGLVVEPVLAEKSEIAKLIKTHLGVGGETIEGLVKQKIEDGVELLEDIETDGSELSEMAQEASVIRLVNEILLEAIESRTSDVHIESQQDQIVIRYRIDGMLHTQPIPPEINHFRAAIISRLKIMARLNIAEKRLPQDGRIKLKVKGREIDVRVSVIPMIHGESLVMRILDKGAMVFELQSLGMAPDTYATFSELIKIPHGIVLVTGPTGSGKTTTLYSSLIEINDASTKIITTEDPVEYQLAGINQIQVHSKIGLTFAASLRSILRHDPDVVLVGEIRDLETAENAIQASLTGHLVFSTLHTNDAAGAFTRMCDMGVEPFLVASTVEAVMAQRLVRRLCRNCRRQVDPSKIDLPKDFPVDQLQGSLYEPAGCRECRNVGYSGRMGVYELLVTTEAVRELAQERASTWEIKKACLAGGMKTLRDDGWRKVIAGDTSVEEILRITKGDRLG
ncbi:GspE/PulE family protein [Mariniblastus fucicola]|uniref:Type II secretion system protein E n=1 Tax=Mariniblastus fucicola TaxID=980251 RepID=A0A5B9P815_9BACT|nr:ATPase, T2SS/T4P/T4SS family [Mariniblastus fucicola]QEG22438.1 Type II secretion system protein E [Mariniblastus fucicola]